MKFRIVNNSYENYRLVEHKVEEIELSEDEAMELLLRENADSILDGRAGKDLTEQQKKLIRPFMIMAVKSFLLNHDVEFNVEEHEDYIKELL